MLSCGWAQSSNEISFHFLATVPKSVRPPQTEACGLAEQGSSAPLHSDHCFCSHDFLPQARAVTTGSPGTARWVGATSPDRGGSWSLHNAPGRARTQRGAEAAQSRSSAPPSRLGAAPAPLYLRLQRREAADCFLLCSGHSSTQCLASGDCVQFRSRHPWAQDSENHSELPAQVPTMAMAVTQKFSHLLSSLWHLGQKPPQPERVFTVDRAEVPPLFWKPYIDVGYRPLHQTWRFYFRTLFQQHNEAVNVWTHLLAALVLLLRLALLVGSVEFWEDPHALPLFIIVLASFTYLSFSALAHLLQAKSEFWHYSFFFLDYVGVAVYQFGSALAHFYYAIEPSWHAQVQAIFLPTAAFLAWLSCTGSCYNKYSQNPGLLGRTCQEVPSALAYALDISPVIHRILVSPLPAEDDPALLYHKCQVVFFLLAAAFFSTVMPEQWFPGSCHVFGQGHQVFHVFLVLCTLAQLEAVTLDYQARRPIYEPLHARWPHDFFGLFLLTVGSSVLTALFLSQLVRRKLHQKIK